MANGQIHDEQSSVPTPFIGPNSFTPEILDASQAFACQISCTKLRDTAPSFPNGRKDGSRYDHIIRSFCCRALLIPPVDSFADSNPSCDDFHIPSNEPEISTASFVVEASWCFSVQSNTSDTVLQIPQISSC